MISKLGSFVRCRSLLLVLVPMAALPATGTASSPDKVVMQIAVVRHGIRAPTKAPKVLGAYSTDPWPEWPVAPGQLTAHGAELMTSIGNWYRTDLAAAGLHFGGCATADTRLKVISDSTQRNHDSAVAVLKGFAPNCALRYHALPPGQKDPLFRGRSESMPDSAEVKSLAAPTQAALHTLQETLLGCTGSDCLTRAKSAGTKLLVGATADEALDEAGSLAENLMLEYAQGMPLESVGWGRLGGDGIAWVITLHNASFNLRKRPSGPASVRDGNMLAHIVATLSRAAGEKPRLPSLAPGARALILVGHDTDLATQAGLLDVDWHEVTQPDDYPPGGMLIYQLLKTSHGYGVRLKVALPTLSGLRGADVRAPGGMHERTLQQPACGNVEICPLGKFEALIERAVPATMILPDSGNEPLAH